MPCQPTTTAGACKATLVPYTCLYQDGNSDTTAIRGKIVKAAAGRLDRSSPPREKSATHFVTGFMDEGIVDVDRVAEAFRMSKGQLAETAALGLASVSKANRRVAPKAQTRVTEMLEIIGRVRAWSGGEAQAMAWYRSQPIPALDGRTPEALVTAGRAGAVREFLDHFALGGFA